MVHCQGSILTLVFPWISLSCQSLFAVFFPLWLGTSSSGAAVPVGYKWRKRRRKGEEGGREGGRVGKCVHTVWPEKLPRIGGLLYLAIYKNLAASLRLYKPMCVTSHHVHAK